jgi:hypothetical protein
MRKLLLVITVVTGTYIVWAGFSNNWPFKTSSEVQYRNEQFGFRVELPESWKGFTVYNQKEDIYDLTGKTTTNNGVIASFETFYIRNPLWSAAKPRQDIPIMVFTTDQWRHIHAEEYSVGAAPIPPSELAHNSAYVFALPPRYNYAFPEGWEEVEQILSDNPVHAFEPSCIPRPACLDTIPRCYPPEPAGGWCK